MTLVPFHPVFAFASVSRIERLTTELLHEKLGVRLGREAEDVVISILVNDLMTSRTDEQAVPVAERRLLSAEFAEGQLGRQRYLMWIHPVYFCRSDFAFASRHDRICS